MQFLKHNWGYFAALAFGILYCLIYLPVLHSLFFLAAAATACFTSWCNVQRTVNQKYHTIYRLLLIFYGICSGAGVLLLLSELLRLVI